jgi:hypothetical protein
MTLQPGATLTVADLKQAISGRQENVRNCLPIGIFPLSTEIH